MCVFVRDGIRIELREDLHCDNVEGIFIEILSKKSKHFIVAFIYKPPETSKNLSRNFDQILSEKLRTITKEKKEESETLIDVVFSNSPNNISHTGVINSRFE